MPPTRTPPARLGPGDVACWVLKTRTPPDGVVPGWAPGAPALLSRCVRRSYRLDLLRPGQRCLLWLSGPVDPGVHAIGHLQEPATAAVAGAVGRTAAGTEAGTEGRTAAVGVVLHRLAEPVPRAELVAHPVLAAVEVVRMPAGSNPSYLTPPQLEALLAHVGQADLRAAGWPAVPPR